MKLARHVARTGGMTVAHRAVAADIVEGDDLEDNIKIYLQEVR
jgi:hypothetical protein